MTAATFKLMMMKSLHNFWIYGNNGPAGFVIFCREIIFAAPYDAKTKNWFFMNLNNSGKNDNNILKLVVITMLILLLVAAIGFSLFFLYN
jgi:hypothetical protein